MSISISMMGFFFGFDAIVEINVDLIVLMKRDEEIND